LPSLLINKPCLQVGYVTTAALGADDDDDDDAGSECLGTCGMIGQP
jgi:hypothetical protein